MLLTLGALVFASPVEGQVVLRNLSVLPAGIDTFDDDQIRLTDGQVLGWDQILQANVAAEQQSEFDRRIQDVGLPLFRIRHRLQLNDVGSLNGLVEPAFQQVRQRDSTSVSARHDFLVSLGAMKSRLFQGRRLEAVEPFVRACELKSRFQFQSEHCK